MEIFLQATAAVLLAVVLFLVLNRHDKDLALLLSLAVCCMVFLVAARYMEPVLEFLNQLEHIGNLNSEYLSVLLKAVGVGLLAEIACMVCSDAGNAGLGKALQMLASFVILWLALPLLSSLMELIQGILGEV